MGQFEKIFREQDTIDNLIKEMQNEGMFLNQEDIAEIWDFLVGNAEANDLNSHLLQELAK